MVRISVLHDCLKSMVNAEKVGKRQVMIRPSSKVIVKFLSVMQQHGYIGEFEIIDDHRSGKIVVQLIGRLNKCGVISPRFNVKADAMEEWVNNLLPSRQFGYIVLTTSAGIMDHEEARRKNIGGKIIGCSPSKFDAGFMSILGQLPSPTSPISSSLTPSHQAFTSSLRSSRNSGGGGSVGGSRGGLTSIPPGSGAVGSALQTSALAAQLSASVVKEYLASKGLTQTLEAYRLEYLQYQY
ncbi:40S ribosomal protein S22 [Irineochytrium annulatum]|nr:40S ribosomal protein S22 [Irineochytrium annulatum]